MLRTIALRKDFYFSRHAIDRYIVRILQQDSENIAFISRRSIYLLLHSMLSDRAYKIIDSNNGIYRFECNNLKFVYNPKRKTILTICIYNQYKPIIIPTVVKIRYLTTVSRKAYNDLFEIYGKANNIKVIERIKKDGIELLDTKKKGICIGKWRELIVYYDYYKDFFIGFETTVIAENTEPDY